MVEVGSDRGEGSLYAADGLLHCEHHGYFMYNAKKMRVLIGYSNCDFNGFWSNVEKYTCSKGGFKIKF